MADSAENGGSRKLFWACFISLVATAFAFMTRALLMDTWAEEFSLTETQKGEIFGAGLWPFAISIVLFSLVLDRIGYGKAMVFAFVCHCLFAIVTIFANGYEMLYWGSFIGALGNGTVEAVINPLIAGIYRKEKTKWLNILHAGWPGGLVITGLVVLALGADASWQLKIGLIFIPTIIYGVMLLGCKFPVSERVEAGVTHKDMLKEMGWGGAFVILFMMVSELANVAVGQFNLDVSETGLLWTKAIIILGLTGAFAAYVKSFGRPLFVFLLVIMILLATTELGTDAWIGGLMGPVMEATFGLPGGVVFIYTAFIMMMLRFNCGPIVERLNPLGLLAVSSALAAIGLVALSTVEAGTMIIVAATIYGCGQTFFWPTTLGVVSEQYPKGGAMTINVIAGVGMLGVGILGAPWLGYLQDTRIDDSLRSDDAAIHAKYVTVEKTSIFGDYTAVDGKKLGAAPEAEKKMVEGAQGAAKKDALKTVAILPLMMLACYVGLLLWFRSRGGYKQVEIT